MAKRTPGHKLASENHQRPQAQVHQGFPLIQGKTYSLSMYPVQKDPGVVHIWYNIPSCTVFAQQSNGDAFRTQLCHSDSSPQIHHPFEQSFSLAIPGRYQKTIWGPQPHGPAGVGLLFNLRIIQGVISRVYQ
ncbi:hypothetical protein O181_110986 [Austropuccinia psidii MF-1]|uniref:Uncharacterized protein n=1 Tax=Austropuccinia psidii MF-1 TaxID=1389203 RepID=A0A9Q3K092_9BASI|nr:hypothetical protein [Austropuccinia psidii MF-1]